MRKVFWQQQQQQVWKLQRMELQLEETGRDLLQNAVVPKEGAYQQPPVDHLVEEQQQPLQEGQQIRGEEMPMTLAVEEL
jgi:hypothetical protein